MTNSNRITIRPERYMDDMDGDDWLENDDPFPWVPNDADKLALWQSVYREHLSILLNDDDQNLLRMTVPYREQYIETARELATLIADGAVMDLEKRVFKVTGMQDLAEVKL